MATSYSGIVGSFRYLDNLLRAIKGLKAAGYQNLQSLSPIPHHEIDEALAKPSSPVRVFTLIGGLLGSTTGLVLTIATSLHYPLVTGGKPIVSLPPFLIIVFELTILFGGLFTLGGMLLNARLPQMHIGPAYNPRFSEDRFGLWVACAEKQHEEVIRLLENSGAEDITPAPK